jgi:hypothetical protein
LVDEAFVPVGGDMCEEVGFAGGVDEGVEGVQHVVDFCWVLQELLDFEGVVEEECAVVVVLVETLQVGDELQELTFVAVLFVFDGGVSVLVFGVAAFGINFSFFGFEYFGEFVLVVLVVLGLVFIDCAEEGAGGAGVSGLA